MTLTALVLLTLGWFAALGLTVALALVCSLGPGPTPGAYGFPLDFDPRRLSGPRKWGPPLGLALGLLAFVSSGGLGQ